MINLLDRAGEEEELSLIFFVIKTLLRNIKLVFGINWFFYQCPLFWVLLYYLLIRMGCNFQGTFVNILWLVF